MGGGREEMNPFNELRAGLCALAKRSVGVMGACANEESTKLYLALPMIGLLGYDYSNPYEVYPEHAAHFEPNQPNKVDLAIMRDGNPVIAIECKKVGSDLVEPRAQLRAYYNALPTMKLAILTNGIVFDFFVDSMEPNAMDEEPFLTLDLDTVSRNGVGDEVLETLIHLTKDNFNPETVAEMAHIHLCKKRLRTLLIEEAKTPSEEFCRFFLHKAGLKNVRKGAIERHYGPLIKNAFEEALVLPVVQKMRAEAGPEGKFNSVNLHQIGQRIVTTERELAIVNYVRRRLAFLVSEDALFNAIDQIEYKDYLGKLAVYYNNERNGRLFDYVEGGDGINKFIFPAPFGEIVTNNTLDIDEPLKATFTARVREMGPLQLIGRLAQIA
jgi:predicted type IV restriction endonuclease